MKFFQDTQFEDSQITKHREIKLQDYCNTPLVLTGYKVVPSNYAEKRLALFIDILDMQLDTDIAQLKIESVVCFSSGVAIVPKVCELKESDVPFAFSFGKKELGTHTTYLLQAPPEDDVWLYDLYDDAKKLQQANEVQP